MATCGPCRQCPSGDCVAFTVCPDISLWQTLMQSLSHLTEAPVIASTLRLTMMQPQKSLPLTEAVAMLLDVQAFKQQFLQDIPGCTLCEGVMASALHPHESGWRWYPCEPHRDSCGANRPPREPTQTSAAVILLYIIDPLDQQSGRLFLEVPTGHTPTPFAMSPQSVPDTEHPELYTNDPRLFGNEDAHFITTLNHFNLILKFKVPVALDGGEDGEFIFYSQLCDSVMQHFTDHNLRFSTPSPSLAPPEPMPLVVRDHNARNAWHALCLLAYPWTLVGLGTKPTRGFRRKLHAAAAAWFDFKILSLQLHTLWSSMPDTVNPGRAIYFIAPKAGPLEGPLPDQFSLSVHGCFALHLQHALGDLAPELYPIECGPTCPSDNLPPPGQITAQNVSSSRLNESESLTHDSDQENEQVRRTMALSLDQVRSVDAQSTST
ncbi:hypothetical protein DFH08DRAFT_1042792 [Mycena albidolilacea]|uniref:Uncharacterized protein n=1 Tax=Mycena albidolilacea TaxID=1033008 RepID=A0AAD7AHH3_9AGAR|nr:hypothetical protein DFH08DRAFT_1042792 [Mycena albidolilacea]